MSHLFYEEEQKFSSCWWVWVFMLALFLGALAIVSASLQASYGEMVRVLASIVFTFLPLVGIIFFSKLQLRIDQQGIHYKFFPAVMKWRTISPETINSVEVSEKKNFLEKIERGYKNNRWCKTISMNISGKKIARIKLNNGKKINIGSENPEAIERALKKLVAPPNLY